jgi:hypothetical protein
MTDQATPAKVRLTDGLGVRRKRDWLRGYYCAVAVLLREAGSVTTEVRSLYEQGGDPAQADPHDVELFEAHGLHA